MSNAVVANDFLGEKYEVPESGNSGGKYMKLKKDETVHFRVVSQKALKGWEYWTAEGKPKRVLTKPSVTPVDIRIGDDNKPERIRHFWAMVVWDYQDSAIKILQVTQQTIQKPLIALVRDTDFGHPRNYDLKISRTGTGLETEYSLRPLHKPFPIEAERAITDHPVYLEALLYGEDPFNPDSARYATAAPAAIPVAAIDNLARLALLREWTGYTKAQVKTLAEKLGLKVQDAAQWSDGDCTLFRNRLFLDWGMGQSAFTSLDDASYALGALDDHGLSNLGDADLWDFWLADVARRKSELMESEATDQPETEDIPDRDQDGNPF